MRRSSLTLRESPESSRVGRKSKSWNHSPNHQFKGVDTLLQTEVVPKFNELTKLLLQCLLLMSVAPVFRYLFSLLIRAQDLDLNCFGTRLQFAFLILLIFPASGKLYQYYIKFFPFTHFSYILPVHTPYYILKYSHINIYFRLFDNSTLYHTVGLSCW